MEQTPSSTAPPRQLVDAMGALSMGHLSLERLQRALSLARKDIHQHRPPPSFFSSLSRPLDPLAQSSFELENEYAQIHLVKQALDPRTIVTESEALQSDNESEFIAGDSLAEVEKECSDVYTQTVETPAVCMPSVPSKSVVHTGHSEPVHKQRAVRTYNHHTMQSQTAPRSSQTLSVQQRHENAMDRYLLVIVHTLQMIDC